MLSFQGVFPSEENGSSDVWSVLIPLSFASMLIRPPENVHNGGMLNCYLWATARMNVGLFIESI